MLLFLTILFVCSSLETNAKYTVPFGSTSVDDYTILYVNASVGTPSQQVKLVIRTESHGDASPTFAGGQCESGSFDPSKSSTYVSAPGNGVSGTDTFTLTSGYTHKNLQIQALNWGCWVDESVLSLSYDLNVPSIIPDYAKKQQNQVAVLAFAQVGDNNSQPSSGTLVIGDTASDLCQSDWQYLPFKETSDGSLGWDLKVDRIKAGSFEKTLSTSMLFLLFNYDFFLDMSVYSQVERILGIDEEDRIPCNTQTVIELGFNGNTWKFGPNTYMDLSTKDSNGMCKSRIQGSGNGFYFPYSFVKNNCLMYDYKNKQVGVSASKIAV